MGTLTCLYLAITVYANGRIVKLLGNLELCEVPDLTNNYIFSHLNYFFLTPAMSLFILLSVLAVRLILVP
jgi:hypothetical protein